MAQRQAAKSLVDDAWETVTPTPAKRSLEEEGWETVDPNAPGKISKPSLSADLLAAKAAQRKNYPTQLEKQTSAGPEGAGPIETFSRNVSSGFGIDPDSPVRGTLKNVVDVARSMKESYLAGRNGMPGWYGVNSGVGRLAVDMAKGFGRNAMEGGADIGEGLRSGDATQVAKGAGHSLGFLASLFAGRKAPAAAESVVNDVRTAAGTAAERMYESALKPGPRSNTLADVRRMVKTGLEERIPINVKGTRKLRSLADDLNAEVSNTINAGGGAPINKFKVASRLNDTAKKFATQVNPESDLAALSDVGNEFLRNAPGEIKPSLAQELKQGTYRQLKSRAFGELKGASIEGQKAIARGLKEELEAQFPNIKGLNQRNSNLFNLEHELETAVSRNANRNIFGIGDALAGTLVDAATGSTPAGLFAAGGRHLFGSPAAKSKIAIALSRLAK